MADSRKLVPFIKKWEGGYVNDPYDKGGETNMGITIGTWKQAGHDCSVKIPEMVVKNHRGQLVTYKNVTQSLFEMTEDQWHRVFKNMYWDRWRADEIASQSVAHILVDWIWASGVWGIKIPQRLLGVKDDGIVGPKTIGAVNSSNPQVLFADIFDARVGYIDDICRRTPTNERFRKGWMNRLNGITFGG